MNNDYKITKIVRALWLAEKSVCMRVCKYGCEVNMFCFSRANHASTNLKKVWSWKTRQVYFIYPFPCPLKLEKSLETCGVNFCRLTGHFKRENPYFGKPFFCKTKTDYVSKLRVQDFATGKNFSFNQCSKQESFAFFSGKLFYKSNRKLFSCVCISWCKHSRGWENSRQLCKPDTKSRVCIWLSRILPYPSRISYKVWWHGILELTVVLKVAQRFCFCWYLYYWICAWSSVARLLISVSKQARLMFSISEFP